MRPAPTRPAPDRDPGIRGFGICQSANLLMSDTDFTSENASRRSGSDSEDLDDTLESVASQLRRVQVADPASGDASNGLARLVLTLVQLLHDVLEKQAVRRMESGTLTDDEVERVGRALMHQAEEIERLCDVLGVDPGDLDVDLGTIDVA